MELDVRRTFVMIDEKSVEAGQRHEQPIRLVSAVALVANPSAGRYVEDMSKMIAASAELGALVAGLAVSAMGGLPVQAYGKAGIVGLGGELEHVNALLTTTFAEPLRVAVGGGLAWLPSFTKRAAPGASIDVPMAHKDALYVRSHYLGMTVHLPPETPDADEIAVIVSVANRGRLNARVGGLKHDEILVRDGQR